MESVTNYTDLLSKYTFDIHKALNGYIPYDDVKQMVGLRYAISNYYFNNDTKFSTFLINGLNTLRNNLISKYLDGTLSSYGTNGYTDIKEVPFDEESHSSGEGYSEEVGVLLADLEKIMDEKEMEYVKIILLSDTFTDKDVREKLGLTRGAFRSFKARVQRKMRKVVQ